MLRNLGKIIITTQRQLAYLVWICIIIMVTLRLPMAGAENNKPELIDSGSKYDWYNGQRREQVWLANDEIAVFQKRRSRRAKDIPQKPIKDLKSIGEIVKQSDFVTYVKLPQKRTRTDIAVKVDELQMKLLSRHVSPVFYSGRKNKNNRMALTGEIIIHFFPDWSKNKIDAWLKDKSLSIVKSFPFSPNTFLVDAGYSLKSLETANEIYLSGEVRYAYPNWLKTRVTRNTSCLPKELPIKKFKDKSTKEKKRKKNVEIPIDKKSKVQTDLKSLHEGQKKENNSAFIDHADIDHTDSNHIRIAQSRETTRAVVTCYPRTEDYWVGSTSGSYGYEDIFIEGSNGYESAELRGFAKFNISSIPDGSTINNVELHVYCYKDVGMPYVDIRRLASDPVTSSWETIFEEVGSGTLYVNDWIFSDGYALGQWEVSSLGYTATKDLQMSLAQDWFAVGFTQDDYSTYYAWCYGSDSISYKPYIKVSYDPPPICVDDDPLFPNQWHLENSGQCGGIPGEDVNISSVWSMYKGDTIIIAVVDDGLEIAHEDLVENVISGMSWDYVDGDIDPSPKGLIETGAHGTACAGIAAARGWNCLGGRGAAPLSRLIGHRLLGAMTDENEADALIRNKDIIDIYSNSWGVPDGGEQLEGPGPLTEAAIAAGAANGRGGLGNIYVWAGGNGYDTDNVNYDGYANSRYTIAVAACDDTGVRADYSEKGANILVNAPGGKRASGLTTTERTGTYGTNPGNYTSQFTGTSAAAPLVAGIIALMLEANPNLSWRDVQHILIETAEKNDPDDFDWEINSAGFHINHKYGFGRINAAAAVTASPSWAPIGPEQSTEASSSPYLLIPDNNTTGISDTIQINENFIVEYVEIYFNADNHPYWGDLEIELISPIGTKSILAEKHPCDETYTYHNWRFGSIRHFGENAAGIWTLRVKDLSFGHKGTFQSWRIKIYGYTDCSQSYPHLTCPADITAETDLGVCTVAYLDLGMPEVFDACDPNPIVSNNAPAAFPKGTTTITWTAQNASGNETSCTQMVTISDNEPPQFTCPPDLTVNVDPGMCTASNIGLGSPEVSDNCDPNSIVSNDAPSVFHLGSTQITWTAQDAAGNKTTSFQTITVEDNEPPEFIFPEDIIVSADPGACTASNIDLGLPSVIDVCDPNLILTNNAPAIFPMGATQITWTAHDASGNETTCTQTIIVEDNEPPQLICSSSIMLPTSPESCTASNDGLGNPIVYDNCDSNPTVSNDATSSFAIGLTTVTWTAQDAAGNTTTCAQTVMVKNKIIEVGTEDFPYQSIQEAIDNACNGDTVIVHEGTYTEKINLSNKSLVIKSKKGAMHTILDGDQNGPVVSFDSIQDPNARFSGFTITNGNGTSFGGGIYCQNSHLTISNNIISDNSADYGAGIYCQNSSPMISNNTIVKNTGIFDGIGIYADEDSSPTIMNTIFWDNNDGSQDTYDTKELYGIEADMISYSNICSGEFAEQNNNICNDPSFVNPDKGNYHLRKGSPCRDAGNPDESYYDLNGTPNDMGADGGLWGVQDTEPPHINECIITPATAKIGEEISFTAEAIDEWGIAAYSWDFDVSDGLQEDSQGKEAFHSYQYEGNYVITLTVEDANGLKDRHTEEIIITPKEPPRIVSITASPSYGNEPLGVFFHVEATDLDGNIVSYQWDFHNDGIYDLTLDDPNTHFTLRDPNIVTSEAYKIKLCVTDDDGLKAYGTTSITLVPSGHSIVASDHIGKEGGELRVTDPNSILNGVKVSIPQNLLPQNITLTISEIGECPPSSAQRIEKSLCMAIGPSIDFQSSFTITVPYNDNELNREEISPEQDIKMYSYDTSQSKWTIISDIEIDIQNHCINAKVYHFSLFKIDFIKSETGVGGDGGADEWSNSLSVTGGGCFITTCILN